MRWSWVLLSLWVLQSACSGCPRSSEEILSVTGQPVSLEPPKPAEPVKKAPAPPPPVPQPVKPPETGLPDTGGPIKTGRNPQELLSTLARSGTPPVPPGSYVADDLTQRLREKMAESYDGDLSKVPDAKIYLGNDSLENFSKFYEQRGYKTERVTIPVSQIIQAATRDRPELANKVNMADYEGVIIEQVMVDGTGVSAANKYIDPDTLKVVDKLFVTVMPLK